MQPLVRHRRLMMQPRIDVVAQSATRAAPMDRSEIEQSFLIRRALEMESAAQAATHMDQEQADRLHEILARHERAVERRHFAEAIAQDDAFHHAITEISNLPRLWGTIEISKAQLDRCRHMMLPRAGQAEATLEQHREIVRGLNSHDPAKAAALRHLEGVLIKAYQWANTHPAEWIDKYYVKNQNVTADDGWRILRSTGTIAFPPLDDALITRQQATIDVLDKAGQLPKKVRAADDFDLRFAPVIEEAKKESGAPSESGVIR